MITTKRLDSIVEFVGGGTPSRKVAEFFTGTIPWVSPKDVKTWEIHDSEEHITDAAVSASTTRVVQPGAVLLVIRSGVLKHSLPVAINRVPVALNQDMKALICNGDVCADYLAHFLKASQDRILQRVRGTTADNIPTDVLKQTEVPLPPLPEQRRIAAILDKADAIRRKREEGIRLTEELLRSTFLEMFGDPEMNPKGCDVLPISSIVKEMQGGKSLLADADESATTPYRVLKVSAVTWADYRPDESKPVPLDYVPPPSHVVKKGDLLFSRANTTELVGATVFVFETPPNRLLPDKLWRFVWQDAESIDPQYMRVLFMTPAIKRELGKRATGTSGSMKNISKAKLMNIPIPVPPVALQRKFGVFAMAQHRLLAERRQGAISTSDLFGSLVQRAFRGEL